MKTLLNNKYQKITS